MPDKITKFKEIMSLLNNGLDREEFLSAFKKVLEIITQIKTQTQQAIDRLEKTYTSLIGKVDKEKTNAIAELKAEGKAKLAEIVEVGKSQLREVNGRFAILKEEIITDALSRIIFPEQKEFVLEPKEIRDKLELLKGKDRLDVKAIDGIDDLIDALNKKIKGQGMMGGLRPAPQGVEIPLGTIDSSNKEFSVVQKPQFITIQGQTLYEGHGYALSSSSGVLKITLDNAPITNNVLRSHF